jgi:hypothetical protein
VLSAKQQQCVSLQNMQFIPPFEINNDKGLHIDCLGTNPAQTIDGSTDTFLFVDDHSSIQLAFPAGVL